ncbi:MAG: sensor histidine kinase [Chloroflexi bacterium]|nr:sensor histidine kinase [Chloroflexota bacterium]
MSISQRVGAPSRRSVLRPLIALASARIAQLWDLGWSLAGAVPVRVKILGIVLGMVGLLGVGIVVTLWLTLPEAIGATQSPEYVILVITRDLAFVVAVSSLVGTVWACLLTMVLTRPILDLVSVVRQVQLGDLSRTARVWANDEIGQLADAFNTMLDSLRRSQSQIEAGRQELLRRNRELAQLSDELLQKEQIRAQLLEKVISAQEEERKRIARELHDETSQTLTSLVVGLKVLEGLSDPVQVRTQVTELRELAGSTLEAVHGLALELRPSVLDDLGLVAAVRRHVNAQARKYGLEIDFHTAGLEGVRLPSETETAVYRVIQEALTNVARHAGGASASVIVERRGDSLVAIVEDDGYGFDAVAMLDREQSLGLHGMRERSLLVGGKLTIESSPGAGTTVFVQAPIAAPDPALHALP